MVKGIAPGGSPVRVVSMEWFGDQAAKVHFEDAEEKSGSQLLYRTNEPDLVISEKNRGTGPSMLTAA